VQVAVVVQCVALAAIIRTPHAVCALHSQPAARERLSRHRRLSMLLLLLLLLLR